VVWIFYFISADPEVSFITVLCEHIDTEKFVYVSMLKVKVIIIPIMLSVLSTYHVLKSAGTSKVRPESS
jgi:hypothetical protein